MIIESEAVLLYHVLEVLVKRFESIVLYFDSSIAALTEFLLATYI
jgi:hypothetical protein